MATSWSESLDSLLVEYWSRDRKVASPNPDRSGGRIFFFGVNFVCWLLFGVRYTPRVTAAARKRPRSLCQKCRWQITLQHVYTLDPAKSKYADYAATSIVWEPIRKRVHTQLVRERLATVVSARWITGDWSWHKSGNCVRELISTSK